ncbi:hypothetical protein JCM9279_002909 [Rhodotorula babjevae]
MSFIVDRRKARSASRRPARPTPTLALEPPRERADSVQPAAGRPGSSKPSSRFAVTDLDQHARLLRAGADKDGEQALKRFVASKRARVDDLLRDALRHSGLDGDKLEGILIVVRPTPPDEPVGPAFAAGLIAFYVSTRRPSGHEARSSPGGVSESIHLATDLRLDNHVIALQLVDAALANAKCTPPQPPPNMPRLVWRNSGTSRATWVRARPWPISPATTGQPGHEAYDLLDEGDVPRYNQSPLCEALKTVLALVKLQIGASPHEVIERSRPGVAWEREVATMRAQLKQDLRKGADLLVASPFPGVNPLHYFGRLCWTWTGSEYAIFELVASGKHLIELRVLRTTSDAVVDFGGLCGLPIYTNTPPEHDSAPAERDLRVHFRILGTVQGGNAHTVLVTAFDSLFTSLRMYLHEGGAGPALLTPVLPTVGPDPNLLRRARYKVRHVRGRIQDPQGTFRQTARHLASSAASNPLLGMSLANFFA